MKELTAVKVLSIADEKIYLFLKRVVDIIGGLVGLIILIPLTIIIKLATMATGDFNPVLFTQKRIGKNGKEFNFYKYRSMVPNADQILFEMLEKDPEMAKEYKENKKLKDDPRITKIGRILRRTSLDELPQLINVLKGDMSLVGNRPYLPREKEDMGSFYHDIVKTKPGLTGYWQVSDRKDVSFLHRLKLEQYYSNNRSLGLDIKILFKTLKAVICGHGAAE